MRCKVVKVTRNLAGSICDGWREAFDLDITGILHVASFVQRHSPLGMFIDRGGILDLTWEDSKVFDSYGCMSTVDAMKANVEWWM